MRKFIFALTVVALCFAQVSFAAENWSNYESGRNNIRLEGYSGQPGYIGFEDGSGNVTGYMFMHSTYGLVFISASGWDPTTQQLDDYPLCGNWEGVLPNPCIRRVSTAYDGG